MIKNGSLGRKILLSMIAIVVGMLLAAGIIFAFTMNSVSRTLFSAHESLSDTIGEQSSAYMAKQMQSRMLELAAGKADTADNIFADFEQGVRIVASVAEQIYANPSLYSARPVSLPDAANDGKLTMQVLYSAQADPSDPAIRRELELIGNVQDVLLAVNANQDSLASIYVATESGFMIQADYISGRKFDESGHIMPLEAKSRPWYQGAAETDRPYFTAVTKDAHTPRLAIMCGVPVHLGDRLMGVAGGGMYLDDMEDLIRSIELDNSGNACILNRNGQVLFSTYESGTLAVVEDAADLRLSKVNGLAELASDAVEGGAGVALLSIDGIPTYAAYAPMRTVGWSMVVFLSQEAVEAPTEQLIANIDTITERSTKATSDLRRNTFYVLLGLFATATAIAAAVSLALSHQIAKPIRLLTEKVSALEGDSLDFTWDVDSRDETHTLANAFQSLTQRMKTYISDIEAITSERERISTELTLANRIQEDMLPNIFPAFPDRLEFDIYASMDPAKAVGGDFYDFFLIDDDHLCMVMADVSGKGIPAALFMMMSKIILDNNAMLGMSPGKILTETNAAICDHNKEDMFVTVWLGILEISTGAVTAANAGHEYPVIGHANGRFELMKDKHGFVIGAMDGLVYKEYSFTLEKGDKLFLYTDGVPESVDADGNMFGTDRLLTVLNEQCDASPEMLLRNVRIAVDSFIGQEEQFDDLTMLCIEYKGPVNTGGDA